VSEKVQKVDGTLEDFCQWGRVEEGNWRRWSWWARRL